MQPHFELVPPIRIRHPSYSGVTHQLLGLPFVVDSVTLSDMIADNQLVASATGMTIAALFPEGKLRDCIQHNISGFPEIYFRRWLVDKRVETSILEVSDDRLLIWGVHVSSEVLGVYVCDREGVRLATEAEYGSELQIRSEQAFFPFPHDREWDGKIECIWQSPKTRSLAWLYRPKGSKAKRQLFINGRLLYEGCFEMESMDFVWAPNGITGGARIFAYELGEDACQKIVTPTLVEQIPTGFLLREFLVDNNGHVAAHVLDGEDTCHPYVYDRPNDEVSLAWNFHWMPDGSIGYNYVQQSRISHMTDEFTSQR